MNRTTSRTTICLCAILVAIVIWAIGLLLVRLTPYLVARYHGEDASLMGLSLIRAPLHGAMLEGACLRGADLRGADLGQAYLGGADLSWADLRGANLDAAFCEFTWGDGKEIPATIAKFAGALYDAHTRWPEDFDPAAHGAVRVR